MTQEQEQLEAQSREAIIAWCRDPSVQLECCYKASYHWSSKKNAWFDLEGHYYRIAKPKKWYRVGLTETGKVLVVDSILEEKLWQEEKCFFKWLDERKYYE